jgi:protein-tyrosine phosphatase
MDRSNRDELLKMARGPQDRAKVALLRSFDPTAPRDAEVPDPYYGGPGGFEEVFDICQRACAALLEQLKSEAGV